MESWAFFMKQGQPTRQMLRKVRDHPDRGKMLWHEIEPDDCVGDSVTNRGIREAKCLTYLPEIAQQGHHYITQTFEPALDTCIESKCIWIKYCPMINKEMF